mmetsp:Transcript_99403/g.207071  ORF Transcript_99403/g.207071 Transcript_99403/m.207071 type:complete len:288 (-) Transcript_99403:64-927(-)|eukprot:CAMPEP_0206481380 /NCGR_PEP_ID=MMETSP0324_2-20121206/38105_1 /ASSEMBLY_ACC=CAM_ASM_000836 /TAXON_ID=2866 /ORGANISM="Crypthecodinium cohnii, Strain Seligo" /LENGTH=287 /DNA_ID=CAMNT_0053958847 /DNA_START=155 /DNA_END=1018 /DNA_ORIENTATION=-
MQNLQRLSEAERRFLLDGVKQGLRSDGRGCYDYRRVTFELDPIPTANGSCRLRAGETDLLVCVKCDIGKPSREHPDIGQFQVAVDCAASMSVAFADSWNADDASRRLSVLLETLCAGDGVIDRRALCIQPGVFAWEVYVDVLVLTSGGNLLDSVSLALCAALLDTKLPSVQVLEAMEEGEVVQLSVDDRPEMGQPFPITRLPLCVTVAQIGQRFLFDVTSEEELTSDALLCVVVDAQSEEALGIHQLGRGLFEMGALPEMLLRCRAAGAALFKQLQKEIADKDVKMT